jgi:hypothetical protein
MASGYVDVLVCFTVNMGGSREEREQFNTELVEWGRFGGPRPVFEDDGLVTQWRAAFKKSDAETVITWLSSLNIPIKWEQHG